MADFCSKCGAPVEPSARFCTFCGQELEQAQPPQQLSSPDVAPPQAQPSSQFPPPVFQTPPPQPLTQQPQQPQNPAANQGPMDKQTVLAQAPGALNRPDRPWEVRIEGDSIIAYWKWMDGAFFAPSEVDKQTKEYTFTVTLTDKGTYKEQDTTKDKEKHIGIGVGKLSVGASLGGSKGKLNQKSFEIGLGRNNQTDETGLVNVKLNTTAVKQPIRDYLTSCGWKHAGLFK